MGGPLVCLCLNQGYGIHMATRSSVQAGREALYRYLKMACSDGKMPPGTMLPTVRELSDEHGVTSHGVFQVIQRLIDEGVIYTVPRVGAFVGHPARETVEPYLMVVPPHDAAVEHYMMQAQHGFEDRISQLGGHSIIATPEEIRRHLERQDLPTLSGVFESLEAILGRDRLFSDAQVPVGFFGRLEDTEGTADCVSFDDEGGGAQAARHLLQNGHRSIAFLGLHAEADSGNLKWSKRREIGWRRALVEAGCDWTGLAFLPQIPSPIGRAGQISSIAEAAKELIGREDVSAVVAVNALAAETLFAVFREAGRPPKKWPAIVCFDSMPGTGGSVVSYLRLPWEDIGRQIAEVLWERHTGRLAGPAVQRLVPMRLIPRLSCRADWTVASGLAQSHLFGPAAQEFALELRRL